MYYLSYFFVGEQLCFEIFGTLNGVAMNILLAYTFACLFFLE